MNRSEKLAIIAELRESGHMVIDWFGKHKYYILAIDGERFDLDKVSQLEAELILLDLDIQYWQNQKI